MECHFGIVMLRAGESPPTWQIPPFGSDRLKEPGSQDMRIRNKIHEAINRMPAGALALLYDQIKVLENLERNEQKKETAEKRYSLGEVHNHGPMPLLKAEKTGYEILC